VSCFIGVALPVLALLKMLAHRAGFAATRQTLLAKVACLPGL